MSIVEIFETDEKIQNLLTLILDESRAVEDPILEWLAFVTNTNKPHSFLQLFDNPKSLLRLASITGLDQTVSFGPYSKNSTIVNFVLLLKEIWRQKKQIYIFGPFNTFLHKRLNPSFVFEADFESLIYSHSHAMIFTILVVAILTIILARQNEEEEGLAIFDRLGEMQEATREFLKQEFRNIVALFDEMNNLLLNAFEKDVIRNAGMDLEKIPRLSGINDFQIFKRIEEQTKTIERFEQQILAIEAQNAILKKELELGKKTVDEKDKEIQHLKFSREDLLDKLKNKKLEFDNDVLIDKESEIKNLKERIQQIELTHQAKVRDLEDEREGLHKKIHMLQNYKIEFESIQNVVEKQTSDARKETQVKFSEEVQTLKDKILKLQESSLIEKEKYLDLEMKLSKQNFEIHTLKMEKQNLDYKIRELEIRTDPIAQSEIYTDNLDQIAKELSCASEVSKLQALIEQRTPNLPDADREKSPLPETDYKTNDSKRSSHSNWDSAGDPPPLLTLQREIRLSFANYERRCLSRLETILRELKEEKARAEGLGKEVSQLREEVDLLTEKSNQLEGGLVDRLVEKSPAVQELLRSLGGSAREGSEIAQDLLKTVLKREQEINRLKSNRKKLNNEILNTEARCIENLSVVYTIVESFFAS